MKKRFNEYDQNYAERYRRKKRLARKQKIKRILIRVFVLALMIVYFLSPVSRFNVVKVEGNQLLTQEQVIEAAQVDPQSLYVLDWSFMIKRRLKQTPVIEDVYLANRLFYGLTIIVKETAVLGYGRSMESLFFFDGKGNVVLYDDTSLEGFFVEAPKIVGIEDQRKLQKLAHELTLIPESVFTQISEIRETNDHFNQSQLVLVMNDRKFVYVSVDTMSKKLKYYNEVVSHYPDHCHFYFDIEGNAIAETCK